MSSHSGGVVGGVAAAGASSGSNFSTDWNLVVKLLLKNPQESLNKNDIATIVKVIQRW